MTGNHQKHFEEAADLALRYPWFAYAHLARLSQLAEDDPGFKRTASEVSLHFTDSIQLDHLLNKFRDASSAGFTAPDQSVEEEMIADPVIPSIEETGKKENEESFIATTQAGEDDEDDYNEDGSQIAEPPLNIQHEIPKPELVETTETELSFEPLHTTDYFASQGIKLSEQQQSGDKLGKQMKSFTAWLKTMKKVHHSNELPPEDANVKIIAEKSNIDEEVVTESMAEVFASQGKTEKARDIYRKLSLINPSKSAYFAQKIDLLNN